MSPALFPVPIMTPISDSWRVFFTLTGLFAVIWYSYMFIRSKRGNPNPKLPPGPPGLPLVGNLPFLEPELHTYFAAVAKKYGPIVKLRFGTKIGILITSPDAAREVLKDHDITFANRDIPAAGLAATYGGKDIVWNPYGPEWRMLRKVCVLKMLSNTTLDSVYSLRRKEIRETVGQIYSRVGSPVNIGEQGFLTILNVVTSMLWGGTVQGEERARIGAEFREVISDMTEILGLPNVSDFFPGLARFDMQGHVKRMKVIAMKLDAVFDEIIERRLKNGDEGSHDFLQFLLKYKDEGDSKTPFTMTHLRAMLMDMVVGGSDTSSNSIEFTMAEILNHPEVLRKVQEELDAVVGNDKIVEESHIHKLPYLLAVMKESLRLHPVLPLMVPHCPSQTVTVGGYTIPKESRIFVNVWAIHRDPLVWENPLEFSPERFLSGGWDFSGSDFRYLPFGSGRRMCAGIAMAERMVLYTLATLLHSFDWKFPEGQKKLEIAEKFGIVLKLKTPLVAIPTPRLSDHALYE